MRKLTIFGFVVLVIPCFLPTFIISQDTRDNCESSSSKLDNVRNIFNNKDSSQYLILIGKLGVRERKKYLSKRRLYAVKKYLIAMGVQSERIVTAYAEESANSGSVEIYIEGQLSEIVYAGFNADIPVGSCDNDKEDNQRYQLRNRK